MTDNRDNVTLHPAADRAVTNEDNLISERLIRLEHADVFKWIDEFEAEAATVPDTIAMDDEATAAKWQDFLAAGAGQSKDVDALRVKIKEPYLTACRIIDAVLKRVTSRDPKMPARYEDAYFLVLSKLKDRQDRITAHRRELERQEEERQRQIAVEAERKRQAAEAEARRAREEEQRRQEDERRRQREAEDKARHEREEADRIRREAEQKSAAARRKAEAEAAAKEAEAKRLERAEAKRQQEAAEAEARRRTDAEKREQEQAEEAAQAAADAEAARLNAEAAADVSRSKSADLSRQRTGRSTGSLADKIAFEITDLDALEAKHLWPFVSADDKKAAVKAFMQMKMPKKRADSKTGEPEQPLKGVRFYFDTKLQIRG